MLINWIWKQSEAAEDKKEVIQRVIFSIKNKYKFTTQFAVQINLIIYQEDYDTRKIIGFHLPLIQYTPDELKSKLFNIYRIFDFLLHIHAVYQHVAGWRFSSIYRYLLP